MDRQRAFRRALFDLMGTMENRIDSLKSSGWYDASLDEFEIDADLVADCKLTMDAMEVIAELYESEQANRKEENDGRP